MEICANCGHRQSSHCRSAANDCAEDGCYCSCFNLLTRLREIAHEIAFKYGDTLSVAIDLEAEILAALQNAEAAAHPNFPRSSQNQTASSGVEGAHEGTTADKSGSREPEKLYRCKNSDNLHAVMGVPCPDCKLEPEKLNTAQSLLCSMRTIRNFCQS